MRLSTFNVENMFQRAKAMNLATWGEGKEVLADFAKLNELIQEEVYTDSVKSDLLEIMSHHKGLLAGRESDFIILRDVRGKFLGKPKGKPVNVVAAGRGGWIGWFDLIKEPVKETATLNTARIIGLVNADVLCVVEAEDRIALKRFSDDVLPMADVAPYGHIMLIDGNDGRGIDVGIMTRSDHQITCMRSHVDDEDDTGGIFSRDCVEYEIKTPQGNKLLVMINHFKSKGYGNPAASAAKRLRQAKRVRAIYDKRISEGYKYIAIAGDMNEVPDAPPMAPLVGEGSRLTDIMAHAKFTGDGRLGTYGNGTGSGKLDYILMSPELSAKVVRGGIERQGVWGGKNGTLFPHLSTIVEAKDAASDHAALWVDLDI